jgi:hypothetical protein
MKFWLVKCRKKLSDGREGWTWDDYSQNYKRDRDWGGDGWIKSSQSMMFIREVCKDDLVVCYQYEGKRIWGLTRMAGDGHEENRGAGYNTLYLAATSKGLCIEPRLDVEELRATGCDPEWLRKGQGTVFPISPIEFRGIVRCIRKNRPNMKVDLERWLPRMRWRG